MGSTIRARDLPAASEGREGAGGKQANRTQGLVAAATAAMASERRHERETMSDFISKKREMFLVQMSLDTKRDEIRKVRCRRSRPTPRSAPHRPAPPQLEEKARMKEQALRRSELILEEDAMRFETFLKARPRLRLRGRGHAECQHCMGEVANRAAGARRAGGGCARTGRAEAGGGGDQEEADGHAGSEEADHADPGGTRRCTGPRSDLAHRMLTSPPPPPRLRCRAWRARWPSCRTSSGCARSTSGSWTT